eukprot:5969716-Pyramimonas_sp.AAC.1
MEAERHALGRRRNFSSGAFAAKPRGSSFLRRLPSSPPTPHPIPTLSAARASPPTPPTPPHLP